MKLAESWGQESPDLRSSGLVDLVWVVPLLCYEASDKILHLSEPLLS